MVVVSVTLLDIPNPAGCLLNDRRHALIPFAALSVRPKETVAVFQRSERLLGAVEFRFRGVRCHQPEWKRVAPGVIADPVTLGVGSLRERAMPRSAEFFADNEERRRDPVPCEHVEHERRHLWGGTIVE